MNRPDTSELATNTRPTDDASVDANWTRAPATGRLRTLSVTIPVTLERESCAGRVAAMSPIAMSAHAREALCLTMDVIERPVLDK